MTHLQLDSPELAAVEVQGVTRAGFLVRGAIATGAAYGATAVGPYVANALAASAASDVDILNFALTLEYLETAFYKQKGPTVGLTGEAKALVSMFGDQEDQHVMALTSAVKGAGGTPASMPKFDFPVDNQASFLRLAYTLENVGVGAYNGAGPSLHDPAHLAAAGSIVQVEARHAAAIAILVKKPITPTGAFDRPLTKSKVLAKAGPLINQA
jgi:hypothetical protein